MVQSKRRLKEKQKKKPDGTKKEYEGRRWNDWVVSEFATKYIVNYN